MMFIIKSFDEFFIQDAGTSVNEVLNPHFATVFDSYEDALEFSKCTNNSQYYKVVSLEDEITEFNVCRTNDIIHRNITKLSNDYLRTNTTSQDLEMFNYTVFIVDGEIISIVEESFKVPFG